MEKTKVWELYEKGRSYHQRLSPSHYDVVETNTEFFTGNQWRNLSDRPEVQKLPHPTFNIIKRVATLFIASLTSSNIAIQAEPLSASALPAALAAQENNPVKYVNALMDGLLEKLKFEFRFRDALYMGAKSGDFAAHFWFDPEARPFFQNPIQANPLSGPPFMGESPLESVMPEGEIRMELLNGINVMFGNPNDRITENQPYILIVGRDLTKNLREEARRHLRHGGDPEAIQPDSETQDMAGQGGKIELDGDTDGQEDGKSLYVLMYEKKAGRDGKKTVYATKATKTGIVYANINTGLSVYPLAWGNWEKQENQYHGRALVSGLIDNQIAINTLGAAAIRHLQQTAFPKVVYDADMIPVWSNKIGEAVAVRKLPHGVRIPDLVHVTPLPEMSGQIHQTLDKIIAIMRECLGATEALSGNARPENTSALMVLEVNSKVPLENIRANLYEWAEDIGHILIDMAATYYGWRYVGVKREIADIATGPDGTPQLDPMTGRLRIKRRMVPLPEQFDFSTLKDLWLTLRIDVGGTTYFNQIARTQTLDNLYKQGFLTKEQYLKRLPEHLIVDKEELLEEILQSAYQDVPPGGSGGPSQGGPLEEAAAIQGLPDSMATQYRNMNNIAQKTAREMGARALL